MRQDLIRRHGDRADILHFAGVFGDVGFGQVGLVEDFADPLFDGRDAGGEDQRRFLHHRHRVDADDGLARAAGQHDDAAAAAHIPAGVEDLARLALVIADHKRQPGPRDLAQLHRQRRSFRIPCQVFRRITDADERLLQHPAIARFDHETGRIDARAEIVPHARLANQLLQERLVGADELELLVMLFQLDPAITLHTLGNLGQQIHRHGELAVLLQHDDHVVSAQARRSRVPQRQIAQSVGMDMLRALLQLRKRRKCIAGLSILRIIDLHEDGAISLNDQRIRRVVIHAVAHLPCLFSPQWERVGRQGLYFSPQTSPHNAENGSVVVWSGRCKAK